MSNEELNAVRMNLKLGDYDGVDLMKAWIAIDELIQLREWRDKAFQVYPNIDVDIEFLVDCDNDKN